MALSVTCSKISQDAAGRIHIAFSDGLSLEFPSKEVALDWGQAADVESAEARTLLRRLLMMWWLKRDPTGATPATVVGKTLTLDLAGPTLLGVG